MRRYEFAAALLLISVSLGAADKKIETFPAYVDTDICARLLPGLVSPARLECSQSTHKEGSNPVLVRTKDHMVLTVNKQKLLKNNVGKFVQATGEVKAKDGEMKLQSAEVVEKSAVESLGAGEILDVRLYKATGASARIHEQVRHELAMMPYISEYDFLSFIMYGNNVVLTGWTVRITNRDVAYNLAKNVEGVGTITNNIDVLPLGRMDNTIRANARAKLQRFLSRYFWGSGSAIKIIVKNGDIILLGSVATKADSDVANIQCQSVPNAFHVFNRLRVEGDAFKEQPAKEKTD